MAESQETQQSQNSGQLERPKDNSSGNNKKKVSKSVSDVSKPTLKEVTEIIFMIRQRTKGKMDFKKISITCGWCDSRVSQVLRNWDNPKYVSVNSKQKILDKLKECLDSVSRKNNDVKETLELEAEK